MIVRFSYFCCVKTEKLRLHESKKKWQDTQTPSVCEVVTLFGRDSIEKKQHCMMSLVCLLLFLKEHVYLTKSMLWSRQYYFQYLVARVECSVYIVIKKNLLRSNCFYIYLIYICMSPAISETTTVFSPLENRQNWSNGEHIISKVLIFLLLSM